MSPGHHLLKNHNLTLTFCTWVGYKVAEYCLRYREFTFLSKRWKGNKLTTEIETLQGLQLNISTISYTIII